MARFAKLTLTLLICLLSFSNNAWTRDKVFNAQSYTLDNGMEIVVVPNNRTPVVTHMVCYKVGSADEQPGHTGLAHFLEHLMFKGSLGFGPGEFSRTIKALGGNDNAFTSRDFTAYFQSISSKHLELVMRMEAGRMRGINPPLDEVNSEREVVREERRQRTDNNPQNRFSEAFNNAFFVNHPYANPIIGWGHEIPGLTWNAAKAFYDQHYGPNNAILVVSGDVTGEQVYKLAKEIYGAIKPITLSERAWPTMPILPANQIVTMEDEIVQQPISYMSLHAPSFAQDKETSLALQILQEIMGGGPSSRLYKSLVIDQKIAAQAGLYYDGQSLGPGELQFYAYPLPDVTPERIEKAFKDEIKTLIDKGLTDAEIQDAKTRMIDQAIYARDSLSGPAMIIGRALASGAELDDVENWPHKIAGIKKEKIEQAAKDILNLKTNRIVYGRLLPKTQPQENITAQNNETKQTQNTEAQQ